MAARPIFTPAVAGSIGTEEKMLEFHWHAGMAKSQKQKSIQELHAAAAACGISPILEISSKSEESLGVALSAFNLRITTKKKNNVFTVETAFQGSKVFELGGPYKDMIGLDSLAAKKDIRLQESGKLIGFEFFGKKFPLVPRTFFYDWVYINALHQNPDLATQLTRYQGFSDIEFNPNRSINCQACSAALYVSLSNCNVIDDALSSPERFLEIALAQYQAHQGRIII